jgi:hypothetical protein
MFIRMLVKTVLSLRRMREDEEREVEIMNMKLRIEGNV